MSCAILTEMGAETLRAPVHQLPGMQVFERGWLSANNVLLVGPEGSALIDSGYATHSAQTLALVENALGAAPLDLLLNTHLHSDHCGGNAALQERYPALRTLVPAGEVDAVRRWDREALTYEATGQECERFWATGGVEPGQELQLGNARWQVHGAPGHDPHSVILFEPASRTLLSADALWAHGFGVVFPELEGEAAFGEVAVTLDLIESLGPKLVVPGHGSPFTDVTAALARARARLDAFTADPARHAAHATKVLLKFKLLDAQVTSRTELTAWAGSTRYFSLVHQRWFASIPPADWLNSLIESLCQSGAAEAVGNQIRNA